MKRKKWFIVLLLIAPFAKGQQGGEWARQKETAIQYLLEQIAALHGHTGLVKKGYGVARQGLQTIAAIKNGDWQQHADYLASLAGTNPNVAAHPLVEGILLIQEQLLNEGRRVGLLISKGPLPQAEKAFYKKLLTSIHRSSETYLAELKRLIREGAYTMKDNERLQRIAALQIAMQRQFVGVRSLGDDLSLLMLQQKQDAASLQRLKMLYDKP